MEEEFHYVIEDLEPCSKCPLDREVNLKAFLLKYGSKPGTTFIHTGNGISIWRIETN